MAQQPLDVASQLPRKPKPRGTFAEFVSFFDAAG